MNNLLIVSTEVFTGKTGICLSIALKAMASGKKVGYMKPVGNLPFRENGSTVDRDAAFVKRVLKMDERVDLISPVVLNSPKTNRLFKGERFETSDEVKRAYDEISKDKELIVMEGSAHINDGRLFNVSAYEIAELLNAKMLLVTKLDNPYEIADDILVAKDQMKDRFQGVICNWVRRSQRELLTESIAPYLEDLGVKFYGFIPREQELLSVSVRELSEKLRGQVLCAENRLEESVDTFMVGAMGQEQALRFFQRQSNKAVITGGDRSDVQLAALETPTKALILTGNYTPTPTVLGVAEQKGIPVVLVDMDTLTAVDKTESLIGHVRVHEKSKLEKIQALVGENADLDRLIRDLSE